MRKRVTTVRVTLTHRPRIERIFLSYGFDSIIVLYIFKLTKYLHTFLWHSCKGHNYAFLIDIIY